MGFRIVNEPPAPPVKASKHVRRAGGKLKKTLVISAGLLSLGGVVAYNHVTVKSASANAQKAAQAKPAHLASTATISEQSSQLDYGSNNHGIPSAKQLEAY